MYKLNWEREGDGQLSTSDHGGKVALLVSTEEIEPDRREREDGGLGSPVAVPAVTLLFFDFESFRRLGVGGLDEATILVSHKQFLW